MNSAFSEYTGTASFLSSTYLQTGTGKTTYIFFFSNITKSYYRVAMGRLKTFENKVEPVQPAKDYNDSRSTQHDLTKLKNYILYFGHRYWHKL